MLAQFMPTHSQGSRGAQAEQKARDAIVSFSSPVESTCRSVFGMDCALAFDRWGGAPRSQLPHSRRLPDGKAEGDSVDRR